MNEVDKLQDLFAKIDENFKNWVNLINSEEKLLDELALYGRMNSQLDYQNVWFDPILVSLIELDSENKEKYFEHLSKVDKLEFEFESTYTTPVWAYKKWRYLEYVVKHDKSQIT